MNSQRLDAYQNLILYVCFLAISQWGSELDVRALAFSLQRFIVVIGVGLPTPPTIDVYPPTLPRAETDDTGASMYFRAQTGRSSAAAIKLRFPTLVWDLQTLFLVNSASCHYFVAFAESAQAVEEARGRVARMQGVCVVTF